MEVKIENILSINTISESLFIPYLDNSNYLKDIFDGAIADIAKKIIITHKPFEDDNNIITSFVLLNGKVVFLILFVCESSTGGKKITSAGKKVAQLLHNNNITNLSYIPFEDVLSLEDCHTHTLNFIEGLFYGIYHFDYYKTKKEKVHLKDLILLSKNEVFKQFVNKDCRELNRIFYYVNIVKDLTNKPANDLTPQTFADYIKENASKNIDALIKNAEDLEADGLNLIAAVGRGSLNKPKFIILTYINEPKNKTFIYVIGKGVTFDSGGTNLKPTGSIETMKSDMAGAAVAYSLINLIAASGLNVNVRVLIPLVENIAGTLAFKPGDIYTSYSGKTVEVQNTDAEGRLILADSLAYATRNNASIIIDIATLTGACVVALGAFCAGYFTNNEKLDQLLKESSNKTYEDFWRLPLYMDYKVRIKSKVADLQNVATQRREAGSIIAALFLEEFVEGFPWLHLDIAGPAFIEEEHPIFGINATGFGLRTLFELIKNYNDNQHS